MRVSSLALAQALAATLVAALPAQVRPLEPGPQQTRNRLEFGLEAPQPPSNDESPSRAWSKFRRRHGARWQARWSKIHGTPRRIFGPGLQVSEAELLTLKAARPFADQLLQDHRDLLGFGASTMAEVVGETVGDVHVFMYEQRYGGLRVLGGRADVRIHKVGRVPMFGASTQQIPSGLGTTPSVDPDLAVALAYDLHGVREPSGAAELVVWGATEGASPVEPKLAYEVVVYGDDPLVAGRSYIDARTGREIEWKDEVYSCAFGHEHVVGKAGARIRSVARAYQHLGLEIARKRATNSEPSAVPMTLTGNVRGWAQNTSNGNLPVQLVPMPGIDVVAVGVGTVRTDDNGDFSIAYNGSIPVNVTVRLRGRHCGGVSTNVGAAISQTLAVSPGVPAQFILGSQTQSEFDRAQLNAYLWIDRSNEFLRSVLGNSQALQSIDRITAVTNIADTCNATYSANNTNFFQAGGLCNNTSIPSVIAHEWGHGIDDVHGRISQIGGLSEGWGDTVATFLTGSPIVGEGFRFDGSGIRSALNTGTRPDGGFPSGGPPHPKGQVFLAFNWEVREGLIANLGAQAGELRARNIVLGSLVANAQNQPDALLEIFMLDDDNGDLTDGTPNYTVLANAARRRNIPIPEIEVGTITHTPLTTVDQPLTAQVVRATATPAFGSFARVDLVFSTIGGERRRAMINTSGNDYIGLLPGVLSPLRVDYFLEATHVDGGTARFPETGTFGYTVGIEQPIYADDFENGANGWTFAQLAGPVRTGSNDWQLGSPLGRSGTSSGVEWRDPTGAFEGAACWGNDLGLNGFNGAYQSDIVNELRSPPIDLTGRTGVRVRFQRWLTVEEAVFDQAELLANGQQIWRNPLNGNLIDTAWQSVEYDIPNPAASTQFAFRLSTDGGLQLGGWAVDNFEVFSVAQLPPPGLRLTVTSGQVPAGSSTSAVLLGAPNAVAILVLGRTPGPTSVAGLDIEVAPFAGVFPIQLDSIGLATFRISAPATANGDLFYTQAVQFDGVNLSLSNPQVILLGGR